MIMQRNQFLTDMDSLAHIRKWVDKFLLKSSKKTEVFQFKLAIDELCSNIIKHGGGKKTDTINIKLSCNLDSIEAEVVSRGKEFNLKQFTPLEVPEILNRGLAGGLGIRFIQTYVDDIKYSHIHERNTYTLTKNILGIENQLS